MEHVVTAIGHVALRVADLGACVEHGELVLGLRTVERTGTEAFLTRGNHHHALHLIQDGHPCVDHIGLAAGSPDALDELRGRLAAEGIQPQNGAEAAHVEQAVTFTGPEGFTFEVFWGMEDGQPDYPAPGIRPRRLGHVNLRMRDASRMAEFLQRVLDFKVSDVIGDGQAYFLRCNQDHHGIAATSGDGLLHHHAWEVRDVAELVRLCDLLDERRVGTMWGPVRHGAGENIAVYHREPSGAVAEHYADMERIYDDGRYRRGWWAADDPRWLSRWGPAGAPPGYRELGLPARPA
ncbi:MAG: VOC family protein [Candidatus Dormibacteraeota bacterium]|nr:VOC family protein [Candidatus Dormibacteraeota bacterium]MBO0704533.1 VOC family protein [Candidatus Dormibacteraeota bacterium]MBO0762215.1 VOC family protein [Candidatus Dormibacteraeota bacterium]